jgi:hypothetical protein
MTEHLIFVCMFAVYVALAYRFGRTDGRHEAALKRARESDVRWEKTSKLIADTESRHREDQGD